ncbi:LysR family transcriptional regulator [Sphingomonas sp. Ant20]|uniref:LysR family transcriptional regulator n=1 Tax=Sphingomonas sp. Ant20 TaxID=104605 RepID=UPI00068ABFE6|nr:LysR family transcriptional regulator [Sphingomonas sp. Ant20]
MHDIYGSGDRLELGAEARRPGATIVLRKGRSAPRTAIVADDVGDVDRLERFVASCPDVSGFRFDALAIHIDDWSQVRKIGVHAVVECLFRTWLVSVHEDGADAFRATCYLDAAARQLGLLHQVVTPMAVACSSARFATLPGLTQALNRLETLFGTMLFDRRTTGVLVTPNGARILQRTRRAMHSFTRGCRAVTGTYGVEKFDRYLTTPHVRGLIALAEAGGFSSASETAGISAPSLHRAVRGLETLSGTSLVEQRGRGVELTRAGSRLARSFMIGVAELAAALQETADRGGHLSVGAMALSRSLLLPATLADLLKEQPDVTVDVLEGSYLELVELLRSGKIAILIGALRDNPGTDLFQEPLFADRLTIIGRAEHPLAGSVAGFEQLAAYPWIVARRASGLLDRWQKMFDRSGMVRPEAPIQCGSVALIRGVLVRIDFLTLLSKDQVSAEIDSGALVKIDSYIPDTMRTIGAITRRDQIPTKLQISFMICLKEVAANVGSDPSDHATPRART